MTQTGHLNPYSALLLTGQAQQEKMRRSLAADTKRAKSGDTKARARVIGRKQRSRAGSIAAVARRSAIDKPPPKHIRVARVTPAGEKVEVDIRVTHRVLESVLDWLMSPNTKIRPRCDLEPWQIRFLHKGVLPETWPEVPEPIYESNRNP